MPATHEYKVEMRVRGDGTLPLSDTTQAIKDWFTTDGVLKAWAIAFEYVGVELPKAPKLDEQVYEAEQAMYRARHLANRSELSTPNTNYQPRHLDYQIDVRQSPQGFFYVHEGS